MFKMSYLMEELHGFYRTNRISGQKESLIQRSLSGSPFRFVQKSFI